MVKAFFPTERIAATLRVRLRRRSGQLAAVLCAGLVACAVMASVVGLRERDEIFGAVVVLHAVDVVDILVGAKQSAKGLLYDNAVLQDVSGERAAAGVRVLRLPDVHVSMARPSYAGEVPVSWSERLNAMPANKSRWMSSEIATAPVSELHDRCSPAASALAQATRNLFGLGLYSFHAQQDSTIGAL